MVNITSHPDQPTKGGGGTLQVAMLHRLVTLTWVTDNQLHCTIITASEGPLCIDLLRISLQSRLAAAAAWSSLLRQLSPPLTCFPCWTGECLCTCARVYLSGRWGRSRTNIRKHQLAETMKLISTFATYHLT